jgi:hypothetical protein
MCAAEVFSNSPDQWCAFFGNLMRGRITTNQAVLVDKRLVERMPGQGGVKYSIKRHGRATYPVALVKEPDGRVWAGPGAGLGRVFVVRFHLDQAANIAVDAVVINAVDLGRRCRALSMSAAQGLIDQVPHVHRPSRSPGVKVSFSSSMFRATLQLL